MHLAIIGIIYMIAGLKYSILLRKDDYKRLHASFHMSEHSAHSFIIGSAYIVMSLLH
ncbi:hypothetical protein FBZ90_12620 [Nitrospirillum pindoramense]|uniref:Uncharacterized protein n=1 Tax=Nitrospirillum amazonense TaxID=28077 RepID=A0A560GL94_9PROT|nr:hypothetical protein FBZ90_12620 [Nitrospirillum amazonense]